MINANQQNIPCKTCNPWRIRDVFFVLAVYCVLIILFLFIEIKFLGISMDMEFSNPRVLILEELVDAFILSLLPIFYVTRIYGVKIEEIGIKSKGVSICLLWGLISGILLWCICSLINEIIKIFAGPIPTHPYMQILLSADDNFVKLIILLSVIIITPISEEIFFRGFAFTIFKKKYGYILGAIASSVLFTGVHFHLHWFLQIFIVGIFLALLFERTSSLVSTIIAHSTLNALTFFIGKI